MGTQKLRLGKPSEPSQTIWFYSNVDGIVNVSIANEFGMIVHNQK